MDERLVKAWEARKRLRAEALVIWADGQRLNNGVLTARGWKHWVESEKLETEGNAILCDAIISVYGEGAEITFVGPHKCALSTGEVFE